MARLRVEKLQEAIKQELSKILLQDIKDPRIKFVTVTGVELTDDISLAKVYVSLYGTEKDTLICKSSKHNSSNSVAWWNRFCP